MAGQPPAQDSLGALSPPSIPRRILIVRGGAIGDFVLTLPVFAALHRTFPGLHLEVLGHPAIASLAVAGGFAEAVRPLGGRDFTPFFIPTTDFPLSAKEWLAAFDLILAYLHDPDQVFAANVQRCTRARFIPGPHRPDETEHTPASQVFLRPLAALGITDADPVPRLRLEPHDPAVAYSASTRRCPSSGRVLSPSPSAQAVWLAAHPGSGSEAKNWPEAHWATLLTELVADPQLHLLLVGGEAEGDRLDRLARGWPRERLAIARDLPLPELARRLTACQWFIGHDSGITHLAAAVGLPCLVLWGESRLRIWRPPSRRVELLEAGRQLADLRPQRVLAAFQAFRQRQPELSREPTFRSPPLLPDHSQLPGLGW